MNKSRPFHTYVVIGGVALPVHHWHAHLHAYAGADEAGVVLPFFETMARTDLIAKTQAVVDTGKPLPLQIYAGYPSELGGKDHLKAVFDGMVDGVTFDFGEDTLEVTGRSFAYLLMNTKATAVLKNKVTTDVAAQFAADHGLSFDNGGVPSTLLAGKVYAQDHVLAGRQFRKWDILTNLAEFEDRDLYVAGKTLFYVPRDKKGADPLSLTWGQNLLSLRGTHYAQFSRNITVEVKSYNPKSGQTISGYHDGTKAHQTIAASWGGLAPTGSSSHRQRSRTNTSLSAARVGGTEHYVRHVVGKTQAECYRLARSVWQDITRNEFVLEAQIEGDPGLSVRGLYKILGTGAPISQVYHPKALQHHFSEEDGYLVDLTLVNHQPGSVGAMF